MAISVKTRVPPQPLPTCPYVFPAARTADAGGLLGIGANFEPETVVAAYRAGAFPWPHPGEEYLWFSPDPRAIFEIDGLHVSRRLARTIRAGRFHATVDGAFERVIASCADRPEGTWITPDLQAGYIELHDLGYAHSVEAWTADGELAGGLYGVCVGAMFGAESMFHAVTDGSKAALVALMHHARRIGLHFIDIQVATPHTFGLGAREIPRDDYLARLGRALGQEVDWRG
jgi:leucyl/phenylalanyl-tRNA--protein transferase